MAGNLLSCPLCGAPDRFLDAESAARAWGAARIALRWTKIPPKEIGWYLWRDDKLGNVYVVILSNFGDLRFYTENCIGEWAGPIPIPAEPCQDEGA